MHNTEEQKKLVARLKQRDPAAFKLLIGTYKNQVANICYKFIFNRQDAEDLSQEVFLAVYQGIPNFRGEAKLSTWIYQLSTSKSIDLIRSRKRKKRKGHVISLFGMAEEGREMPDHSGETPGKQLEDEEKGKIIRDAIDSLPEKYRRVFTLSKCEGFGNREVAEILGLTQSAVESLVHRAKKKLRTMLYDSFKHELVKKSKHMQKKSKKNVSKIRSLFLTVISALLTLYIVFCGFFALTV